MSGHGFRSIGRHAVSTDADCRRPSWCRVQRLTATGRQAAGHARWTVSVRARSAQRPTPPSRPRRGHVSQPALLVLHRAPAWTRHG